MDYGCGTLHDPLGQRIAAAAKLRFLQTACETTRRRNRRDQFFGWVAEWLKAAVLKGKAAFLAS